MVERHPDAMRAIIDAGHEVGNHAWHHRRMMFVTPATVRRELGTTDQILRDLGVSKIKLISNNPRKRVGLMGYGLEIVDSIAIEVVSNPHNERYLLTKRDKMGHTFKNLIVAGNKG